MKSGLAGDINLRLGLNTKSAKQSLVSFRKTLHNEFSGDNTAGLNQSIKSTERTVKQLEVQLTKTKQKLNELSTGTTTPKSIITMEKELKQLQTELTKVDNEFKKLEAEQAELLSRQVPGLSIEQSLNTEQLTRFKELNDLILKNGRHTDELNNKISVLKSQLNTVKGNPQLTNEGKKYNQELKNITAELNKQKNKLSELKTAQSNVTNEANKQSTVVQKNTKQQNNYNKTTAKSIPILGSIGKTLSRIGGLVKRVFFFSLITAGLRNVREGLGKLIKSDTQLNSSLNKIKANLMVTGVMIWEKILPGVRAVLSWVESLTQTIMKIVSLITGISIKSSSKIAQSIIKDTNKVKKSLVASFDELDILSDTDKTDTGLSDALSDLANSADDIKLPLFDKLKDILEAIEKIIINIYNWLKYIKKIISDGFWDAFGEHDFQGIYDDLVNIKNTLIEIFTDPQVLSSMNNFVEEAFRTFGKIAGSVASIGVSIGENLIGGFSKFLSANKDNIKSDIITVFDVGADILSTIGDLASAIANIFSAIGSESGQAFTAALMSLLYNTFSGIITLALQIGRDILNGITQPIIENQEGFKQALITLFDAFTPLIEGVSNAVRDIFTGLESFWQSGMSPAIQLISQIFSDLISSILNAFNNTLGPGIKNAFTQIGNAISTALGPALSNLLDSIGQFVGAVVEAISPLVQELQPILDAIINAVSTALSVIIQIAGGVVSGIIEVFSGIINAIASIFSGLANVIRSILNGEIMGAITSFGQMIFNFFQSLFSGVYNAIMSVVNSIVSAINSVKSALGSVGTNSNGHGSRGGSFSTFSALENENNKPVVMQVPALAQGAVLPPNKPFLAMLGDQSQGTNVETPLSTIKEAMSEVLSAMQPMSNQNQVVKLELNGRELGKTTINQTNRENRRIGTTISVT